MSNSFSRCSTLVMTLFIALLSLTYVMVHLDRALAWSFPSFAQPYHDKVKAKKARQVILPLPL